MKVLQVVKVLISVLIVESCANSSVSSDFSEEYYKLLYSIANNSKKENQCQLNSTETKIKQYSNSTSETVRQPPPPILEFNQSKEKLCINCQQNSDLTFGQTCEIIFQELQNFVWEIWDDWAGEMNSTLKVEYSQNFASVNGGAMILSISSNKIRAPQAILQDNNDKYLYTDEHLPISIVIALKEEVSIQRIVIKSSEYYSSSLKQFVIYGAFTLDRGQNSQNWFKLVEAQAKNTAGQQDFRTVNKVVRFLKLKVLSAYGDWTYFTMTQIKVYGSSLYAEAMNNYKDRVSQIVLQAEVDTSSMSLIEDLQNMIALARDGSRNIPQNNLIKYFFQQLQKLSRLEEKQILYMNNLTVALHKLESQLEQNKNNHSRLTKKDQKYKKDQENQHRIAEKKEHCLPQERFFSLFQQQPVELMNNSSTSKITKQNYKAPTELQKLKEQLLEMQNSLHLMTDQSQQQWSQITLIIISVGASVAATTGIFLIIFLFLFKGSNGTKSAETETVPASPPFAPVRSYKELSDPYPRIKQSRSYRQPKGKK